MSIIAGTLAILLTVLAVLLAASALIAKSLYDGSLQADVRWVRAYIRTEFAHYKYTRQN
jgi:membrane-bound metal-dependent hydrolase YbcI (DUF457 family)